MLLIPCPHCGPRNGDEFSFGGELVERPLMSCTEESWRAYLYERHNIAGWQKEQWFHVAGCRRYLEVERNTVSNEIRSVRDVAAVAP